MNQYICISRYNLIPIEKEEPDPTQHSTILADTGGGWQVLDWSFARKQWEYYNKEKCRSAIWRWTYLT